MTAEILLADTRPRRGSPAFALTPLADVMFQLLVFFMLTAQVAPYSLLPLAAPSSSDSATGIAAPAGGSAAWHVSSGQIRAGNAVISLAELPEALAALREVEIGEIVLFAAQGASVQDLATVLEALSVAGISQVRLMTRPGAGAPG